jgi:hypothetical protein
MKLSFNDKASFIEAAESLRFKNSPSDPDTLQEIQDSASNDPSSNPKTHQRLQEKSEVIFLDNPPDNLDTLGQIGSMTPQEKSGDT